MLSGLAIAVVVIQITLIALAALLLNWGLRRCSAAQRNGVWLLALAAIAMTVPSKFLVPPISVPVASDAATQVVREKPTASFTQPFVQTHDERWEVASADSPSLHGHATLVEPKNPPLEITPHASIASGRSFNAWQFLGIVYIAGVVFFSLRLVCSAVRLARFARAGFSLPEANRMMVQGIADSLSLRCLPSVRVCQRVKTPLVFGLRAATVLLPESFCDMTSDCQRSVLTHEMAHISRRDGLWDLFSQIIRCAYWIHPFVHLVVRAQRRQRELATDERVVGCGIDPIEYSKHLLEVLHQKQSSPSFAIAMSHFGDMESRLEKILRFEKSTGKQTKIASLISTPVFLLLTMVSVQLVAQEPVASSDSTPSERSPHEAIETAERMGAVTPSVASLPSEQIAQAVKPQSPAATLPPGAAKFQPDKYYTAVVSQTVVPDRHPTATYSLSGRVTSVDGLPVDGAAVLIRVSTVQSYQPRPRSSLVSAQSDVLARVETDANGRYRFENVASIAKPNLHYGNWSVFAITPNGQHGSSPLLFDREKNTLSGIGDIQVAPVTTITGTWITPEGQPIVGASAFLMGFCKPGYFDGRQFDQTKISAPLHSTLMTQVTTNAQGRFQFQNVPVGMMAVVGLVHKDWCGATVAIATSDDIPLGKAPYNGMPFISVVRKSGDKHTAESGLLLKGRVVNQKGQPVSQCLIRVRNSPGCVATDQGGYFMDRVRKDQFLRFGEPSLQIQVMPGPGCGYLYGHNELTMSEITRKGGARIVLSRSIPVIGKVLDEDGQPVVDATVQPSSTDGTNSQYAAANTKSDGSFKFVVAEGQHVVRMQSPNAPKAQPYEVTRFDASLAEYDRTQKPIQLATIRLTKGERVPIRCVDERGQPIKDANVKLIHRLAKQSGRYPEVAARGATDESGGFTFRPPVVYASDLVVRAELNTDTRHLWGEATLIANPINQLTTVVMKKKWRVRGKVTNNGRPMPGVKVMLWRQSQPGDSVLSSQSMGGEGTLVNDDGTYEWYVPPNGSYSVEVWGTKNDVRPKGGRYRVVNVGIGELEAEEIKFIYAEGKISGRAMTADGIPISGIRVFATPKSSVGANKWLLSNPSPNTGQTNTADDGTFTIEGLPEGRYRITASSVNFPRTHYGTSKEANVGEKNLNITMMEAKVAPGSR